MRRYSGFALHGGLLLMSQLGRKWSNLSLNESNFVLMADDFLTQHKDEKTTKCFMFNFILFFPFFQFQECEILSAFTWFL
jgi:hypothetical protein